MATSLEHRPTSSPPTYSPPPSRKSSSASNTTSSSSLASPPSPAVGEQHPPNAWEIKVALDELELTPHRSQLGQADEASQDEYFPAWKAEDAFELSIPPSLPSSAGARTRSRSGSSPLSQPLGRRSSSLRLSTSSSAQSTSFGAPTATSPSSPETALSTGTSPTDGGERLPHLHLLPRPSMTPAQRKYSSSLKSATRKLLSLSLNAGSPSTDAGSSFASSSTADPVVAGGSMFTSPETMESSGLPWDQPRPSFGQVTDDGEFALSSSNSPVYHAPPPARASPSLSTKTSYAELRAQAEERQNALLALRRDSDGSPFEEEACILEEEDDSSDLSDSESEDGFSSSGFSRKRSVVRRRSGWRTDGGRQGGGGRMRAGPSSFDVASESESDEEGASHIEFGSSRMGSAH